MDIQKEKEAFEKEMLDTGYVIGNISAFWDEKNQNYDIAITELRMAWCAWKAAKAQAVPEGFVLVKKVHPDAIVHNQGLGLFKECQVIYGWDGKSKDFKDALNKGFYHGVKLGAKAVLETTMIEAQEQGND